MGFSCGVRVEALGFSGGIWCMWRTENLTVNVIGSTSQCIHLQLINVGGINWILSIVYASPNELNREDLWSELSNFSSTVDVPWCVMGDFNSILYDFEKIVGVGVNRRSMNAFASCLENCSLQELSSKGPFLTWQRGNVKERLDRVVCSQDWVMSFQQSSVINLALPTSDHCGIWLRLRSIGLGIEVGIRT
ncbi:Endonuclease/exonuclease/phosphatase [Sesbania bispinosa]|nr:Endonuclease/exonuclease/phosphatase [Sesbania bispinosa]